MRVFCDFLISVPAAAVAAPTIPAAAAAPIASATPTLEAEKDQVESPTLHIEDASEVRVFNKNEEV